MKIITRPDDVTCSVVQHSIMYHLKEYIHAALLNFPLKTCMISPLSDTEDWSNDAENQHFITGINYILQYFHIENSSFKL